MDAAGALQLMRTSRERWTTLRGVGRDWRHYLRHRDAFVADLPEDDTGLSFVSYAVRDDGVDPPEEDEEPWRVWVALPDRIRLEFAIGMEMGQALFEGSTWWSYAPRIGGRSNETDPTVRHGMGPGFPLTDPARFVDALDLVAGPVQEVAGRNAQILNGLPSLGGRDDRLVEQFAAEDARDDLGSAGAEEFELAIDVERGVVLRSEAKRHGQPFRIIEFVEVFFDEEFPADTFTLDVPPGTEFESPIPKWWRDPIE